MPSESSPTLTFPPPQDGAAASALDLRTLSRDEWITLLRADQRQQWRHGRLIPVEAYQDRWQQLPSDLEAVLDLIGNEIALRGERGEQVSLEEYQGRFPSLAASLQRRFELWQALAAGTLWPREPGKPAIGNGTPASPDLSKASTLQFEGALPDRPLPTLSPEDAAPSQSAAKSQAVSEHAATLSFAGKPARWDGTEGEPALVSEHAATLSAADLGMAPPTQKNPPGGTDFPSGDAPAEVPGYEIQCELGRGGMGVVYRARHIKLNRLVAIKMILHAGHASRGDRSRFRTEAEAVARLQHPNIVQIHEIGEHQGAPYFSLEFCAGGSLADCLDGTPLPPQAAATLVRTLAEAMEAAHRRQIVHRDLKPANVLLVAPVMPVPGQAAGAAVPAASLKISDFGLAKKLDDQGQTRTGSIMGTPSYMAPEQASGQIAEIGPATDVYALGAILYELLTGRAPFRSTTALDTVKQVLAEDPIAPHRLQAGTPSDLETICLKCLEKQPARRYASAAALAEDLTRYLEDRPIQARPVGPWERARKWARRRPALAGLLVLSVLTLFSLVFGLTSYAAYQKQERQGAEAYAALQRQERQGAEANAAYQRQARLGAERELQDQKRLAAVRARYHELLQAGQAALAREDLDNAILQLQGAVEAVGAEESLAALRTEASRLHAEALTRGEARKEQQRARRVYEEFRKSWDEALFHGTLFIGVDVPSNRAASARAARAALDSVGLKEDGTGKLVLGPSLRPEETERVREGCYELLLLLAETEAVPEPGAAPERGRVEKALRLLEQAAALGLPPSRAYHSRRARCLALVGRAEEARQEQDRASALRPSRAVDHFLMGDERYKSGDLKGAAEQFASALRAQPEHFWAQYFLAVCRLKEGRPAEARAHLAGALSKRPDFLWIHLLSGYAAGEMGQYAEAEADFDRALKLEAKQADPYARYGVYVNRGAMRLRHGKVDEAIKDLEKAAVLMPEQLPAHINLARAYARKKRDDDAARSIGKAIALAPRRATVYRHRARMMLEKPDFAAALKDFRKALELGPPGSPFEAEDHAECGRMLHALRRHADAVKEYDAALTARPEYPLVHRLRAEALLALGNAADAVKAFDLYFKQEKEAAPADVYRGRGVARARLGDYAGAMDDYTRALELEPKSAGMRIRRGWAYVLRGSQLALRDFEQAIKLNPKDGDAYNGRGYARVLLGRYTEAVADADEAVRRGPDSAETALNAACIFAQAVLRAEADASRNNRKPLAVRYQVRSLELLAAAMSRVPAGSRGVFWRQAVQGDPALGPVRGHPDYRKLEKEYSSER